MRSRIIGNYIREKILIIKNIINTKINRLIRSLLYRKQKIYLLELIIFYNAELNKSKLNDSTY
jgi:hypothetical protein